MIVYFSGTGNSRYCAERLADSLREEIVDAGARIRGGAGTELSSERPWIFVTPTYAWRIPRIFSEFIRSYRFSGSCEAYFVMTCGTDIGSAAACNEALCKEKGFRYRGTARILMPENYIAMYEAPERAEAERIIEATVPELERAAACISREASLQTRKISGADRFKTRVVNPVFYRLFVKSRPFAVSGRCIGCGKCENSCVMNNIRLRDGKPVWGDRCTHCMACICGCPVSAIEYGRHSVGRPRYQCPEYRAPKPETMDPDAQNRG